MLMSGNKSTNLTRYLSRCERSGEDPNPDHMKMFESLDQEHQQRFDTESQRENNLEWDMMTTEWFTTKVRGSVVYAQNLYAAFCNNEFQKIDVMTVLRDQTWSCSWRSAGGIIAEIRGEGDYLDWYCSGIMSDAEEDGGTKKGYVAEATVTDEIEQDLKRLGWIVIKD